MNSIDKTYLNLLSEVLDEGEYKYDRTGVGTISTFFKTYKIPLSAKEFPILTTKKINFRALVAELIWYLSGENHIRNLRKYTKIWDAWADEEGNLQTAYGRYWRYYPLPDLHEYYREENGLMEIPWKETFAGNEADSKYVREYIAGDGSSAGFCFDQLAWLVDEIKANPNSRRLVLTAWYPPNACVSKLPPCHSFVVFNVQRNGLNCHLTQRSCDATLGLSWNLTCYSLLTLLIAREVGLDAGYFAHTMVDTHIYVNHLEGVKEQLTRTGYELPSIKLPSKSLFKLTYDDIDSFELIDYQSDPAIKLPVAV